MRQPDPGLSRVGTLLLVGAIDLWRRFVSPLFPPACRFEPSCSAYFRQAVLQRGVLQGCWLGVKRLLRCHPLGGSGYDPVPSAPDGARRTS